MIAWLRAVAASFVALWLLWAASAPAAKKPQPELEKLLEKNRTTNYATGFSERLAPYSFASGDRREAYIVDNNVYIADTRAMAVFLNRLAGLLLTGWPGPRADVKIYIVADSQALAKAWPAGIITISTGMVEKFTSVDVVAGVVAHELGHILAEHGTKRSKLVTALEDISGLASSGGVYMELGRTGKFANGKLTLQSSGSAEELIMVGYVAETMVSDILEPGMKRGQEHEADRIAADLLAKSPFSVEAQADFFGELISAEVGKSERLENARKLMSYMAATRIQSEINATDDLGKTLEASLAFGVDKLFGEMIGGIQKRLAAGEADPEKRREKFQAYTTALGGAYVSHDYAREDYRRWRAEFQTLRAAKPWIAAVAAAKAVSDAHAQAEALALSYAAGAQKGSRIVVQGPQRPMLVLAADDPQVVRSREYRGLAATMDGKVPEVVRQLETGARSPWMTRSSHHRLADAYIAQGNVAQASLAITRGVQRTGRETEFLDLMVARAVLQSQPAQAEKLAARCLSEGGRALYMRCAMRIGYDAACAPRTPEGQAAFIAPKTETSLKDMINLPKMLDRQGQKSSCL